MIFMIVTDWNAVTGTQTPNTTIGSFTAATGFPGDNANYGVLTGYYPDVGAAGNKTIGQTDPNGLSWCIIGLEVKSPPSTTRTFFKTDNATAKDSLFKISLQPVTKREERATARDIAYVKFDRWLASKSESATVKDAVNLLLDLLDARAETGTIGDQITVALATGDLSVSKSESVTADDVAYLYSEWEEEEFTTAYPPAEKATIKDVISVLLNPLTISKFDTATASDILTMYMELTDETIASTDVVTARDIATVLIDRWLATGQESLTAKDLVYVLRIQYGLEVEGFRFREDDGDEDEATWVALQDTNVTLPSLKNYRLRFIVNTDGNPDEEDFQLEVRPLGGDWRKVN